MLKRYSMTRSKPVSPRTCRTASRSNDAQSVVPRKRVTMDCTVRPASSGSRSVGSTSITMAEPDRCTAMSCGSPPSLIGTPNTRSTASTPRKPCKAPRMAWMVPLGRASESGRPISSVAGRPTKRSALTEARATSQSRVTAIRKP